MATSMGAGRKDCLAWGLLAVLTQVVPRQPLSNMSQPQFWLIAQNVLTAMQLCLIFILTCNFVFLPSSNNDKWWQAIFVTSWWFLAAVVFSSCTTASRFLNEDTSLQALLAHVQLVNIWNFSKSFCVSAPSELKSLWHSCSHFPLIRNEVYPVPDELNFLCQKPAISKKIMNNARRILFQISLWGRGSNCEEIKFPLLPLSTTCSPAADNGVRFVSVWRFASHVLQPTQE